MKAKNLLKQRYLWLFVLLLYATVSSRAATDFPTPIPATHHKPKAVVAQKVTGVVTDENDEGIPGVTIKVKGTATGAITDLDGKYTVEVPSADAVLVFSYTGHVTQEVVVGAQRTLDIKLLVDNNALEEVVVVGFGSQKKVNLTGAVGVATAERLENRPISTVGEGLQGVIPNLNVVVRNGDPTAGIDFNIRGYESINGGSPLILVDGVPMDLNRLNPNDIKSISVLKDAAAAAIYGARAAFGVVLVETKTGATGKITVNFGSQISRQTSIFNSDMVTDPYTFVVNHNIASTRNGAAPLWDADYVEGIKAFSENPTTAPQYKVVQGVIRNYGNNNQQDDVLAEFSPTSQQDLSISGGTSRAKVYASLGYFSKDGYLKVGNERFKRYNGMLKADFKINKWLSLDNRVIISSQNSDKPFFYSLDVNINSLTRVTPFRLLTFPDMEYYLKPGDRETFAPYIGKPIAGLNLKAYFENGGRTTFTNNDVLLAQGITLTPFKGFKIRTDISYNLFTRAYQEVKSRVELVNANLLDPSRTQFGYSADDWVANSNNNNTYTVINSFAEYTVQNLKNHDIKGMVGFNQESGLNRSTSAQARGLISTNITDLNATTGTQQTGGGKSHIALRGAFYRLNYAFKEKYLFEANGRYDGSSRFPQASRFGFFPSFSAAWRISNEYFMRNTERWLTNLKVRASYGSLGNQAVGSFYPYISTLRANTSPYLFSNTVIPTIAPPGLVSPTLTWESVNSKNIGLDIALFKGRFDFSFDAYTRDTKDMLLDVSYPDILGTAAPKENGADLQTRGWEAQLIYKNRVKKDLSYDITLALSDWQAEITKYNNPTGDIGTFYVGQKLGQIWGYETVGIFQSPEEVAAAPTQTALGANWRMGDMQYRDLDGNGKIDAGNGTLSNPGDRKIIGNTTPRYTFGINGGISYKDFRLTVFFQGIGKIDYLPGNGSYNWFYPYQSDYIEKYFLTDTWSETNRDAYFAAPELLGKKNIQPQSRYVQNAAYIRLKNITLSYNLPGNLLERLKMRNLQIYLSGMNLWEFSKIRKPLDPETIRTGNIEYPMQRIGTFGLNVSF